MVLIIGLIVGFTSYKINDLKITEICKDIQTQACIKITNTASETDKADEARNRRQLELEKKYYP